MTASPPPDATPATPRLPRRFAIPLGLAAGVLALMVATLDDYGFAWDEGFTVERVDRLREWFHRVAGDDSLSARAWAPPRSKLEPRPASLDRPGGPLWDREALRFYWPFAREEPNGHPPFYALLVLAGREATGRFLPPPASYRFGPALLFALTVGAIYAFIAACYGPPAGLTSALGLVAMPRVFAHAHLASYDAPTLCLWFLAAAAFSRASATGSGRWAVAFGVAWGCAAATKLTGWFVPIPLVAWAIYDRDRRAARGLAIGAAVAAVVVYALIPTWWADPIGGVTTFLRSNLGREARSPIPTQFFGRLYPFALPWYNTLVWTAIVVPPVTLALALAGIGRVVADRKRDRAGTLLLACWGFLMLLRALPNAPGHDGDRLFLAAFGFLACLAGVGVAAASTLAARVAGPRTARVLTLALIGSALGGGAWSTVRFHPLQLSYYNALIGGTAGAARAGMEPTFYWDALTPEARAWLNRRTEPGRSIYFADAIPAFDYLHHWGLLVPPPEPSVALPPQWYVVQNRPGALRTYPILALAAFTLDRATPRFATTVPDAPGVPLVAIFAIEDAAEAEREFLRIEAGQGVRRP